MRKGLLRRAAAVLLACAVSATTALSSLATTVVAETEWLKEPPTETGTALDNYITDLKLQYSKNGGEPDTYYNPGDTLKKSGKVKFEVFFAENGADLQFPENGVLTYTMPNVFNIEKEYGEMLDENGVKRGEYWIDENGKIVIKLDERWVAEGGSQQNGNLWFEAEFSRDKLKNQNEWTWKPNDKADITVKFDDKSDVKVDKKIIEFNRKTHELSYEITVEVAYGTVANLTLTDVMEGNLELVGANGGDVYKAFTITDKEGNPVDQSKVNIYMSGDDNSYTISIPNMTEGEKYTITYNCKIKDEAYDNASSPTLVDNKLSGSYQDQNDNSQNVDIPEKSVGPRDWDHSAKYDWVTKSGSYDDGNKSVTWNVKINDDGYFDVKGNTLTDTLGSDALSYDKDTPIKLYKLDENGNRDGDATLIQWDDANLKLGADGRSFTYTFPGDAQKAAYEFEYVTKVDVSKLSGSSNTVQNNVNYEGHISSGNASGIAGEQVDTTLSKAVTKSGDNWNKIGWKITATVDNPGKLSSIPYYIKDVIEFLEVGGQKYYDKLIPDSVKVTVMGVEGYDKTDLNIKSTLDYTDGNSEFYIYFDSETKESSAIKGEYSKYEITIEYQTKVTDEARTDASDPYKWVELTNNAYSYQGEKEDHASAKSTLKKSDIKVTKSVVENANDYPSDICNSAKGEARYAVRINEGDYGASAGILSAEPLIIDDTFDTEKFELVKDNVYLAWGTNIWSIPNDWPASLNDNNHFKVTDITEIKDASGKILGYRFKTPDIAPEYAGCIYELRYTIKLKSEYMADSPVALPNKAVAYQGESELGSAELTYEFKPEILSKALTAKPNGDNSFVGKYQIIVNKGGLNLSDTDEIVVVDQFMPGMIIDTDTIKVFKCSVNEWGSETNTEIEFTPSYNQKTKQLKITVPDETYIKIEYNVTFKGAPNSTKEFVNKAWVEGLNKLETEDKSEVTFKQQGSGGGVGGDVVEFNILKKDASNPKINLEGAKFDLYYFGSDGNGAASCISTGITTDDKGLANIKESSDLQLYPGVYELRETKAPAGYAILTEPIRFYLNPSTNDVGDIEIIYSGDEYPIYNSKESFKINKVDETGKPVSGATLQIKDAKGNEVLTFETNGQPYSVNLDDGKYTLVETKTPDGYETAADMAFEVKGGKLVAGVGVNSIEAVITMVDNTKQTYNPWLKKVVVNSKTDRDFKFVIAEAENKANAVATVTLKNGDKKEITGLTHGVKYVIYEIDADGYDVAFDNGKSEFEFEYDKYKKDILFTATNTEYEGIKLTKQVSKNGIVQTADSNVKFEFDITDKGGKVIDSVTITQGNNVTLDGKKYVNGEKYTLIEKNAGKYALSVLVNGEKSADGSFTYTKDTAVEILATNSVTNVTIDKWDVTNSEEVEGAELTVYDKDGHEVDKWTSKKGEKHTIEGIIPGEKYTLKETITPDKYETATETVFTVDENGKVKVESGEDASVDNNVLIIDDALISTTEATTEATTEVTTEATTEATTEETTEATTEATTEETTEATTEETTEASTEATTDPSTETTTSETTQVITQTTTVSATKVTTTSTTGVTTESSTTVTTTTTPVQTITVTANTDPRNELVRYTTEELNESDYTPESWAAYKEVLERAKRVLAAGDENEIKAVLQELIEARRNLVLGASVNTGAATEVTLSMFAFITTIGAVAVLKRKREDDK